MKEFIFFVSIKRDGTEKKNSIPEVNSSSITSTVYSH
jgi:hypothetical protein